MVFGLDLSQVWEKINEAKAVSKKIFYLMLEKKYFIFHQILMHTKL